jgi:hypothetical protein
MGAIEGEGPGIDHILVAIVRGERRRFRDGERCPTTRASSFATGGAIRNAAYFPQWGQ